MSHKGEAIELIQALPEGVTFEDILFHLYLMDKARKGLDAIDRGGFGTSEEVRAKAAEWAALVRSNACDAKEGRE